jgi:hypothetical protein
MLRRCLNRCSIGDLGGVEHYAQTGAARIWWPERSVVFRHYHTLRSHPHSFGDIPAGKEVNRSFTVLDDNNRSAGIITISADLGWIGGFALPAVLAAVMIALLIAGIVCVKTKEEKADGTEDRILRSTN